MRTWAVWMFWIIAFNVATKTLALGFMDYPRLSHKGGDALDVLLFAALLSWGVCALWGNIG